MPAVFNSLLIIVCHSLTRKCELIQWVDDDDFIYRVVAPSVRHGVMGSPVAAGQAEGMLQDFILLASKRKPCGSRSVEPLKGQRSSTSILQDLLMVFAFSLFRDPYVIALRSVSLPTHPPAEGYKRGEVLCAGFTILETKDNMTLVTK